ncbi:Mitogen-Activated Protein Kinase Kinase Kinase 5 [Manis pentadactyla]|nr:Mitogen-Activated Protein Kinase Kinase Kinase 5 [Manis pentadactyla]
MPRPRCPAPNSHPPQCPGGLCLGPGPGSASAGSSGAQGTLGAGGKEAVTARKSGLRRNPPPPEHLELWLVTSGNTALQPRKSCPNQSRREDWQLCIWVLTECASEL